MTGVARRRGAAALMLTLAVAGCTGAPPRPGPTTTARSAPAGPALQGHVIVFSPADHEVSQSIGRGLDSTVTDNATAADLSPDLKTLTYVTQDAKLVLRDLASGAEQTVTISAGGTALNPAAGCLRFSPDGKRLAFIATQDGGLYVTTPAGAATRVDTPKHATYTQTNGRFIFGPPDPGAPSLNVASQLTCSRWLDTRRLVFDRVATMPATVTIEQGKPTVAPSDTTTVAALDPVRLIDSPQRWEIRHRCGTRIISSVHTGDSSTDYVVDTTTLGDDQLARPDAMAPGTGKLPDVASAFIAGSCDVLLIASCNYGDGTCATKRYSPGTGAVQNLPATYETDQGSFPRLDPGSVAWNPAGTQYAASNYGYVYVYDLATGAWTFALAAGIVGNHGADTQVLGWLPS